MSNSLLLRAADFAARKHRDQKRKGAGASPFINHPIQVARIIAETGGIEDAEILAAALLHDTVEDTDTTPRELEGLFGPRVTDLVREVTDDKNLPKKVRKQLQIDHAPEISREAALIKLADKISNIQDVTTVPPVGWNRQRIREYVEWAEKVINNLPETNEPLENLFYTTLKEAKERIDG